MLSRGNPESRLTIAEIWVRVTTNTVYQRVPETINNEKWSVRKYEKLCPFKQGLILQSFEIIVLTC